MGKSIKSRSDRLVDALKSIKSIFKVFSVACICFFAYQYKIGVFDIFEFALLSVLMLGIFIILVQSDLEDELSEIENKLDKIDEKR